MTATADFGVVPVGPDDVDRWVIATIATWANTYLKQTELEDGIVENYEADPVLGRPALRDIRNALTTMEFADGSLPTILATTAPTEGDTKVAHDGSYSANFRVVVSCIVRGNTAALTRRNASATVKAISRAVAQQTVRMKDGNGQPSPITHVRWNGFSVAPVADETGKERHLAAGISTFQMAVDFVLSGPGYGPSEPDAGPYGNLPVVTTVDTGFDDDVEDNPLTTKTPDQTFDTQED